MICRGHGEVKVTHANPTKGRIKENGGILEVIDPHNGNSAS